MLLFTYVGFSKTYWFTKKLRIPKNGQKTVIQIGLFCRSAVVFHVFMFYYTVYVVVFLVTF